MKKAFFITLVFIFGMLAFAESKTIDGNTSLVRQFFNKGNYAERIYTTYEWNEDTMSIVKIQRSTFLNKSYIDYIEVLDNCINVKFNDSNSTLSYYYEDNLIALDDDCNLLIVMRTK